MSTRAKADVLVLGVGGMGAAAMAHLASRGLKVIGVEQDDVPSKLGSSVGQTRVIRKAYFEDPRYVPLLERAYGLWRTLEAENESDEKLYVKTGALNLGPPDHEAIRGVLESAKQHSLPHSVLTEDEVRARFPAFLPTPGDIGVYEEDAGYLRAEACTAAHARLATRRGAELRTHSTVRTLHVDAHRARATLHNGDVIDAESLVVTAGAWLASAPAFKLIARDLTPLVVERQVQLWFRPKKAELARSPEMPAFVHFVGDGVFYGVPLADPLAVTPPEPGLKVCRHHGGAETTADALDRTVTEKDIEPVRAYLAKHMPNGDGPVLSSSVCMYTNTPDHHFIVGRHPKWSRVIVLGGFSGHGYKMASVMGEIAADLVERGGKADGYDLDLSLFDPGRLVKSA